MWYSPGQLHKTRYIASQGSAVEKESLASLSSKPFLGTVMWA